MNGKALIHTAILLAGAFFQPGAALCAEVSYSPVVERAYPDQVLWGDMHVHTSMSTGDANLFGGNHLPPTVAYRFARGERVRAGNGMPLQLRRPLDFLVIADHAEALGVAYSLQHPDPQLLNPEMARRIYDAYRLRIAGSPSHGEYLELRRELYDAWQKAGGSAGSVWKSIVAAADAHNEPGSFTAFAGYEWTSVGAAPAAIGNLHRVVIFKDGADKTGRVEPFSALDSRDPADLWDALRHYEELTGGKVLAIPHNGNLSNGEMFALTTFDGRPLTSAYARARSRWEPLYEVTQMKGDGEAHPVLSPNDEFAAFETWSSWAGTTPNPAGHPCCPNWKPEEFTAKKQAEYARSALKRGLALQAELGANPFKFGMVAGTDSHTSFATADNDNFWGKYTNAAPTPTRMIEPVATGRWSRPLNWETGAAGYTAIWADENTRESLFAAMRRKEVYASTGPRMTVRFFGGWSFEPEDAFRANPAAIGYRKGIPMGGELTHPPDGKTASFLIAAAKDPDGANLDRVQVIKGWLDRSGRLHEKVYNVAQSDGRRLRRDGSLPGVGSTVDVATASYSNTIGDSVLAVVWEDPDFNAGEACFYYVRVLEIPTPRWTAYDARYFGTRQVSGEIPMVTQERAYTSPIWYTP